MPIDHVLLWGLVPAAVLLFGAAASLVVTPSREGQSAVEHFTAGVIMAALVAEILPQLAVTEQPVATLAGFAAGVAIMLLVSGLEPDAAADAGTPAAAPRAVAKAALPTALLAALGVDLLIDGVLAGVTLSVGQGGFLILGAVALEVVFVGASLCQEMRRSVPPATVGLVLAGLAALLPIGAAIGAAAFAGAPLAVRTGVLALAAAVLLYLVVEELISEAHGLVADTRLRSALFFLGFILIFFVSAYME